MEFNVKKQKPGFEPIEVNIIIQSKEELMELAMRLNVSLYAVNHNGKFEGCIEIENKSFDDLFWKLKDSFLNRFI